MVPRHFLIYQFPACFLSKKVLILIKMSVLVEPEFIFLADFTRTLFKGILIASFSVCVCLLLFFSELEESLIVLPFSVATEMLTLLNHWLQVNEL